MGLFLPLPLTSRVVIGADSGILGSTGSLPPKPLPWWHCLSRGQKTPRPLFPFSEGRVWRTRIRYTRSRCTCHVLPCKPLPKWGTGRTGTSVATPSVHPTSPTFLRVLRSRLTTLLKLAFSAGIRPLDLGASSPAASASDKLPNGKN